MASLQASTPDPEAYVPVRYLEELLQDAARQLNDPCLGFRIGLSLDLRDLGVLWFVVLNSPTIGIAAENLVRYVRIHQTGTDHRYERGERVFTFSYRVLDRALADSYQDAEQAIGMAVAGVSTLAAETFRPIEIHFRRPTPDFADEYEKLVPETRIRFGQPKDAVLGDVAVLDRPVANADSRLLSIFEQHAKFLLPRAGREDELLAQLEDAMARSFRTNEARIDDVARAMGMGVRTLQRRLSERGLTFHGVAEGVRERLARRHVAAVDLSLTEIAFLLGYSEQSTFGRAFRRWTGKSPGEFRKEARGG